MANPNIVNVTTIYGETAAINVTTANSNIIQNSSSSNSVYKINSLFASNLNDTVNMDINVDIIKLANNFALARNVSIPYNSTIVVISKDSTIYLQEGEAIRVSTSSNSNVQAVCSYEVIS
jgi:hypothetical protein